MTHLLGGKGDYRRPVNQVPGRDIASDGVFLVFLTLACAIASPIVFVVVGLDPLLNSDSTLLWVLLPIVLGIAGVVFGRMSLRKIPIGAPGRSLADLAIGLAYVVPAVSAFFVLFLAWVNGPGGG